MPSHGSLQQAVKVRPGKGNEEAGVGGGRISGFVELFLPRVENCFCLKQTFYFQSVSKCFLLFVQLNDTICAMFTSQNSF